MKINNSNKGFIVQGIVAIVALALIAGGAYYAGTRNIDVPDSQKNFLSEKQTLEIAQDYETANFRGTVSKECLDFDGIRENDFVVYNVTRKFGNGCPEKNPSADYPELNSTIRVNLVTGEASFKTIDGQWRVYESKDKNKTSDWETYTDSRYNFEVIYPVGWKVYANNQLSGVSFGKESRDPNDDGQLFIRVDSERSLDDIISEQRITEGERSGNSIFDISPVLVNGLNGTLLEITNSEISKLDPTWKLDMVIFEKNGKAFILSNGAVKSDLFKKFYNSFKFTSPSTPINTTIPTTKPSITILSPNGGEVMKVGDKVNITYKMTGDIKPEYYLAIILEPGYIPVTIVPATSTSIPWTIPETVCMGGDACLFLESGDYSITAELYDKKPCIGYCMPTGAKLLTQDKSDKNFRINK